LPTRFPVEQVFASYQSWNIGRVAEWMETASQSLLAADENPGYDF
jgi:hypothetical protein